MRIRISFAHQALLYFRAISRAWRIASRASSARRLYSGFSGSRAASLSWTRATGSSVSASRAAAVAVLSRSAETRSARSVKSRAEGAGCCSPRFTDLAALARSRASLAYARLSAASARRIRSRLAPSVVFASSTACAARSRMLALRPPRTRRPGARAPLAAAHARRPCVRYGRAMQHLPRAVSPPHGPYLKDAPSGATRNCLLRPMPPQAVQAAGVQVCCCRTCISVRAPAALPPNPFHVPPVARPRARHEDIPVVVRALARWRRLNAWAAWPEVTEGSFHLDLHAVFADDEHGVVLVVTAPR
jgi:hypothetical protein